MLLTEEAPAAHVRGWPAHGVLVLHLRDPGERDDEDLCQGKRW